MATSEESDKRPDTLTQRVDRYKAEVEGIVARGIEHPNCELKRSAAPNGGSLADRARSSSSWYRVSQTRISMKSDSS